MRRFYQSTEFFCTLAVLFILGHFGHKLLPLVQVAYLINGLIGSYVIGRTLWKKNRGHFYSGALTSEWYLTLFGQACDFWGLYHGLNPLAALGMLVALQALYNLMRGTTKSIGVKTQTIIQ